MDLAQLSPYHQVHHSQVRVLDPVHRLRLVLPQFISLSHLSLMDPDLQFQFLLSLDQALDLPLHLLLYPFQFHLNLMVLVHLSQSHPDNPSRDLVLGHLHLLLLDPSLYHLSLMAPVHRFLFHQDHLSQFQVLGPVHRMRLLLPQSTSLNPLSLTVVDHQFPFRLVHLFRAQALDLPHHMLLHPSLYHRNLMAPVLLFLFQVAHLSRVQVLDLVHRMYLLQPRTIFLNHLSPMEVDLLFLPHLCHLSQPLALDLHLLLQHQFLFHPNLMAPVHLSRSQVLGLVHRLRLHQFKSPNHLSPMEVAHQFRSHPDHPFQHLVLDPVRHLPPLLLLSIYLNHLSRMVQVLLYPSLLVHLT